MDAIKAKDKKKLLVPKLRFRGFTEDWNSLRLGELGSFKNGLNKDSSEFGHGSPFVNLMDVFGKSILMESNFGLVNATEKDLEIYNLAKGDVLFIRSSVKRSGVGETILVAKDLHNTVYSGFLIRFRDRNKELDLNFKSYCFSNASFRNELLSYATSSANTNINQESLSQIKLPYPTLAEQQQIASFLSAVDEKIQQLTRKKVLLEQYKKGVMQQLFSGKLRFKDDNGKAFSEWEVDILDNLTERNICYGVVQPGIEDENGVKFIRGGDIYQASISKNLRVISKEITDKYRRTYLNGGELIMSLVGYPGETAIVPEELRGANLARQVALIDLKKTINTEYVHFYISSDLGKKNLMGKTIGSAQQVINIKTLKEIKIPVPCIEEQVKIATFISSIYKLNESLTKQINQTQTFKKGLLQQMFV